MPRPISYEEDVRLTIRKYLSALKEELDGKFEQTTHGLLVEDIGKHLHEAHDDPSAHSVSNLSQSIAIFLKK